jgi:AcrR family transcriptional regulator
VTLGRRTQAERSSQTRERILVSTMQCLNELGYSKTTTKAIEQRAGVTRGAVMHHYRSKADLLVAAVDYMGELWQRHLITSLTEMGKDLEPGDFVDALWCQFTDPLMYATLEMQHAARTDPTLRDVLAKNQQAICDRVVDAIADRLGVAHDDADFVTAVELTWQFMAGAASSASIAPATANQERLVAEWRRMITPMLRPALGARS